MNLQKEIIRVTAEYLEDTLDYLKLSKASVEYKALLNAICEQDLDAKNGRDDILFENGMALGTFWAALCLDDLLRTRQFIRGIDKAIKDKIDIQKPLHILYAGTGPFATLILPFICKYSKQEITYTFLEINPLSFQLLQNTVSKIGLDEHDITYVKEDATKYQIDPKNKPDIIISETMQNALAKEQQVPIFLNLMEQAKDDSIFIPKKIELFIGLKKAGIPMEKMQLKDYHKEQKVFEVSRESMFTPNQKERTEGKNTDISFTKKQIIIDPKKRQEFNQLAILTEIQVYKDETILINQSGLTTPIFIKDIPKNSKETITIDTQYQISSVPKLEYQIT
jgi:predicted RNA methylase